ncbi:MAG: tRNA (guanosine(37)-N1)-methyltransferase TrmD [Proteobacteria bacterium]|nr:tRNA (guanosine(37)-N1)-methyltransferase TrmD [Pseudomonadota bacterium]MCP4921933.1 tRNA (guanosine(37)-N1)-methyltransferase TrmD [Pseudomonadota bacterium]
MRFSILTLHPELVRSPLDHSIVGRAREAGKLEVEVCDIRDHAPGKHRQADDAPYGGGAGMVMKVDVLDAAITAARSEGAKVLLATPSGRRLDQAWARELADESHLVLVCGHYEGVDARVEELVDGEFSIGDYVLTGGELAALVLVEAVGRLLPGVLGNDDSAQDESFSAGRLEYPQYTRPRSYKDMDVPDVLLSGHHAKIEAWRREQSDERTRARRPDLLVDVDPADDAR